MSNERTKPTSAFNLIALILLSLNFAFPPWEFERVSNSHHKIEDAGYHFLLLPPTPPNRSFNTHLDIERLLLQAAFILISTLAVYVFHTVIRNTISIRATKRQTKITDQTCTKPKLTEDAPSELKSTRRSFITKHWKGLFPLAVSFWIIGLLGTLTISAVITGATLLSIDLLTYQPRIAAAIICVLLIVSCLFYGWQQVGIWRSVNNYRRQGKSIIVALAVRLYLGLTIPIVLTQTYYQTVPVIQEYAGVVANGPLLFELTVIENNHILLEGFIDFGATDELKIITELSGLKKLLVNSPGGNIAEAIELARIIHKNEITVWVHDQCLSACSLLLFSSSKPPQVYEKALVGIHSAKIGNAPAFVANQLLESYLSDLNMSSEFIDRVLATPPAEMWYFNRGELEEYFNAIITDEKSMQSQTHAEGKPWNRDYKSFADPFQSDAKPDSFKNAVNPFLKGE